MAAGQAETESLRRQVKSLTLELACAESERAKELGKKQMVIDKKVVRMRRLEKTVSALKTARNDLEFSLQRSKERVAAQRREIQELKKELTLVCSKNDAHVANLLALEEALAHRPSACLRTKIKALALKYHPDHCGANATVSNNDVTADLVALLAL